jgi:hypothetical protein
MNRFLRTVFHTAFFCVLALCCSGCIKLSDDYNTGDTVYIEKNDLKAVQAILDSNGINPRTVLNYVYYNDSGRITRLNLIGDSIRVIPAEIGQLTELVQLDCSNNQITSLPPEIGNLINLEELDVSSNLLDNLPEALTELIYLEYLDISNNRLNSLPEFMTELFAIVSIDIDNNQICTMSAELENWYLLRDD